MRFSLASRARPNRTLLLSPCVPDDQSFQHNSSTWLHLAQADLPLHVGSVAFRQAVVKSLACERVTNSSRCCNLYPPIVKVGDIWRVRADGSAVHLRHAAARFVDMVIHWHRS